MARLKTKTIANSDHNTTSGNKPSLENRTPFYRNGLVLSLMLFSTVCMSLLAYSFSRSPLIGSLRSEHDKGSSWMGCPSDFVPLCKGFYRIVKKHHIRTILDISCVENVQWLPQIAARLLMEKKLFTLYCVVPSRPLSSSLLSSRRTGDGSVHSVGISTSSSSFWSGSNRSLGAMMDEGTKNNLMLYKERLGVDVVFYKMAWWRDPFPRGLDLVFSWSVLSTQVSDSKIYGFLEAVKNSGIQFILTDVFLEPDQNTGLDLGVGDSDGQEKKYSISSLMSDVGLGRDDGTNSFSTSSLSSSAPSSSISSSSEPRGSQDGGSPVVLPAVRRTEQTQTQTQTEPNKDGGAVARGVEQARSDPEPGPDQVQTPITQLEQGDVKSDLSVASARLTMGVNGNETRTLPQDLTQSMPRSGLNLLKAPWNLSIPYYFWPDVALPEDNGANRQLFLYKVDMLPL